jgi:hypothetical protein
LNITGLVVDAGKFNNKKKSTGEGNAQAERKAMIQELLKVRLRCTVHGVQYMVYSIRCYGVGVMMYGVWCTV